MTSQDVLKTIHEVNGWLGKRKRIMLVCGTSFDKLEISSVFRIYEDHIVRFSDFSPNPHIESVDSGADLFRSEGCDSIVAVGGGSAIDVAKCIRRACAENASGIPFLVIPTTAGSGSEATRFAVLYKNGVKQSIEDDMLFPDVVYFDSSDLKTLPIYQKKSTMLDALSHAIESWWSINSNSESVEYSKEAIQMILKYKDGYLDGTDEGHRGMMTAANIAGKAINITRTTAGHAMCYKITGLFGISHGHAAFLCNRVLYKHMINELSHGSAICIDDRGEGYVMQSLTDIASALGCSTPEEGAEMLWELFDRLDMDIPVADDEQIEELVRSVNIERLQNHPVKLDEDSIRSLYQSIFRRSNAG